MAGIAYVAVAMALMSGQDAILKWLTAGYETMQILFVRGLVVFVVASIVLNREGGLRELATERPLGHMIRCVLNVATVWLFVTAVARLPLADVMALVMASPLFTLALSTLILKERVGARRWTACAIGFVGVLIMLRPTGGAFNAGGAAAVTAAVCYSLMMIQTRRLTETEGNGALMFYTAATMLVVSGLTAPAVWVEPETFDLTLMLAAGLITGLGHFCFVQGYRFASPTVLAPIDYSALLWGVLLGWLIWHELPDAPTTFGAVIVIGSGLYIIRREAVLARRSDATPGDA